MIQGDGKVALFVFCRDGLGSQLRTKRFPSLYQYLCQFFNGVDKVYQGGLRTDSFQSNFDYLRMAINSLIP